MSVILFIMVLVASFIIVRIGAVGFQLTGLEWSLGKFQSLSCFSGTGFTTREAELITGDKRRRRIASVLMELDPCSSLDIKMSQVQYAPHCSGDQCS